MVDRPFFLYLVNKIESHIIPIIGTDQNAKIC